MNKSIGVNQLINRSINQSISLQQIHQARFLLAGFRICRRKCWYLLGSFLFPVNSFWPEVYHVWSKALRGSKKSIRRPHRSFEWKPQPHRTGTRIWKPHRRNMVTLCETRTVQIMVHRLVQFNYPLSSNQSFPVSINHAFTKKPQGNLA